jgi:hypothetical protein
MRGATDAKETATAQTLKSQYGSVRIRDRQNELVRVARDVARIVAEIMAENFSSKTLLDMAQMEFPTDAEIAKQVKALEKAAQQTEQELQRAQADPEVMQMAQQNPEQAQQVISQAQAQIAQSREQAAKLKESVTIEQVMDLLRDQRIRPFVLDIETDSTIQPDEDAEKQRRTEFLTALSGVLMQLGPMVQQQPESAPFAAEVLKFATSPFRAGRQLEGAIEEFAEKMKAMAGQQRPDPRAAAAEADAKAKQEERSADMAMRQEEHQFKMDELRQQAANRQMEIEAKQQADATTNRQELGVKLVEQGLPPDYSLETVAGMNAVQQQRTDALLAELAASRQAMALHTDAVIRSTQAMTQAVTSALTAPKMIIRDGEGRPVGVQTV